MHKHEYEDGMTAEIDKERLAIIVYDDPLDGNYEIIGFESISDIELFLNFSDFTPGKENEFYTIAGKKTPLTWIDKDKN